jgi:hypothetical protein
MVVPSVIAFQATLVPTMLTSVHPAPIIQEIVFNLPRQLFLRAMQMLSLNGARIVQ